MAALVGVVFGLILIAYDDGVQFGLYKKIRCKMGKHTHKAGFFKHVNIYYCKICKAPRKHPQLRAIQGGKIDLDIKFRF